ncbi:IS3 family transposase [Bacillus sp. CGMCC 1.60114]
MTTYVLRYVTLYNQERFQEKLHGLSQVEYWERPWHTYFFCYCLIDGYT